MNELRKRVLWYKTFIFNKPAIRAIISWPRAVLGRSGSFWVVLGRYGHLFIVEGRSGPFWAVLGRFGPFWAVLGRFGPFWAVLGRSMAVMGRSTLTDVQERTNFDVVNYRGSN